MDQKQSPHHNKFSKKFQTKPNKKMKPLKVVYISNPIKVTTSAAGFRSVVQELTGRDSDIDEILTRQSPVSYPAEPCDSLISTRRPPPELGEANGDNSFKLIPEKFGGMDEYFAGLLPLSPLFDME